MHSDEMEDIHDACAGDIIAMFGIDCNSGDTFTDGTAASVAMTSMHVPRPVISLAIKPEGQRLGRSTCPRRSRRFTKEDPTFRVHVDPESSETIISGMGELHLDVYIERMKREYGAEVIHVAAAGRVPRDDLAARGVQLHPQEADRRLRSVRQGRRLHRALAEGDFEFVDETKGGAIPREFIPRCEKGFQSMLAKGQLLGFPVVNVRVTVNDGASHAVDSSDIAFQEAARGALREVVPQGQAQASSSRS